MGLCIFTEFCNHHYNEFQKKPSVYPDQCGSVGWASSHKLKGHRFNSQSGLMPGLQVQSPDWAHSEGIQLMFSLTLMFLSLSYLLLSPLSKRKKDRTKGGWERGRKGRKEGGKEKRPNVL